MRFVILEHEAPYGHHWDLLLDPPEGGRLWCWSLAAPPVAGRPIPARRLPDHRRKYLDYEGSIGAGRGHVRRWDAGAYELIEQQPQQWVCKLTGSQTVGRVVLRELGEGRWEFLLPTDQV